MMAFGLLARTGDPCSSVFCMKFSGCDWGESDRRLEDFFFPFCPVVFFFCFLEWSAACSRTLYDEM